MSTFWSVWVIVLTLITVVGSMWLLLATRKIEVKKDSKPGEPAKTGHSYDGIEEYDNPLPSWWFNMFVGSIIFTVIYLILYPGMGNFKGVLGWTQENQWQQEIDAAEERYGPIFARHANTQVEELALNPEAMKMVMSRTPLQRIGSAEEVANVVAFLAGDKSSYVSGETIYVDGGRLAMNYTC